MTLVCRDVRFDEEKAMQVSLERELELHVDEELRIDVEQPHAEDPRVEISTQVESSREGRKCTREANKLLDDALENVGAPTS